MSLRNYIKGVFINDKKCYCLFQGNMKIIIKNCLIVVLLIAISVSAFHVRLNSFENSDKRSIDEFVYYNMAKQMVKDIVDYNTIPYGKELTERGRPLPQYFFEPLFKHPPVFTLMAMLSMKAFGVKLVSAGYVSLFLSALMIPMIYLLGFLVYDKRTGLLAALFLWMDPVSIMTSQKVWMDTSIAFFTLLAALFFVLGLKKNDWFFILSAAASGLAANTKYTGILITFTIFLFAITYRRDLFKNSKFNFSLVLPFLLLLPWLLWNFNVYGLESVTDNAEIAGLIKRLAKAAKLIIPIGLLCAATFLLYKKIKRDISNSDEVEIATDRSEETQIKINSKLQQASFVLVFFIFCFLFRGYVINSLRFDFIPFTTWQGGILSNEPAVFYFGRLIEYFLVYILAFVSLLVFQPNEKQISAFIRISAVVILLFFIMWGNFQCRYILSSIAFLILLAANSVYKIFDLVAKIKHFSIRIVLLSAVSTFITYSILKVIYLNLALSYTNDMCYF